MNEEFQTDMTPDWEDKNQKAKKGVWRGYFLPFIVGALFVFFGGFLSSEVTLTLIRDDQGKVDCSITSTAFGFFQFREQKVHGLRETKVVEKRGRSITSRTRPEKELSKILLALIGHEGTIYHDYKEDKGKIDGFLQDDDTPPLVISHKNQIRTILGWCLAGFGILLFWGPLLIVGILWNSVAWLLRLLGIKAPHQEM